MNPKDREKTAFSTHSNHYEWIRMPMGLKNSSGTCQRAVNHILDGLIGKDCFVYLDDIVVHGRSLKEHNEKLERIFTRIRKHNLKLQPSKCKFLKQKLIYLGHLISANAIKPDPDKVSCVKEYPTPKSTKDIKAFLGLVGYYRRFIENSADISKPLVKLLRKNVKFKWDTSCQNSLEIFREKLTNPPLLQYPDFEKEIILTTDASTFARGAVLSQGEIGKDLPIAYASRTMNGAETNYSTSEQEMLAVIWGIQQFRPYLWGRHFKIVTDRMQRKRNLFKTDSLEN